MESGGTSTNWESLSTSHARIARGVRDSPPAEWSYADVIALHRFQIALHHFEGSRQESRAARVTLDLAARRLRNPPRLDERHTVHLRIVILRHRPADGSHDRIRVDLPVVPFQFVREDQPLFTVDVDGKCRSAAG